MKKTVKNSPVTLFEAYAALESKAAQIVALFGSPLRVTITPCPTCFGVYGELRFGLSVWYQVHAENPILVISTDNAADEETLLASLAERLQVVNPFAEQFFTQGIRSTELSSAEAAALGEQGFNVLAA